jgi:hypothetical protein
MRPVIVEIDPLAMQDLLHCYYNPSAIVNQKGERDDVYIHWVFDLKGKKIPLSPRVCRRLEWETHRNCRVDSTGIILTSLLRDMQTAFTVAGFILTIGTGKSIVTFLSGCLMINTNKPLPVFLALTGIISSTE